MKKLISASVFAVLCLWGTSASGLTINSPGVVGIIETGAGSVSPENEAVWLQNLLNLANGADVMIGDDRYVTRTTNPEYAGTVDTVNLDYLKVDLPGTLVVPAGWEFVMAKYNGQNAGYVVWYLGGASMELPLYPYELWTDNPEQYAMSHWTAFTSISEIPGVPGVPDGSLSVMLVGFALAVLGLARWRVAT
jgi:hypothetical protein